MDSVREQMELTNEISEAISHPAGLTNDADEVSSMSSYSTYLRDFYSSTDPSSSFVRVSLIRRSSEPSSKRWSRSSSTIVCLEPNEHLFTHLGESERAHAKVSLRSLFLPRVLDIVVTQRELKLTRLSPSLRSFPPAVRQQEEEDDEDAQLRRLQAEMAM